MFTPRSVKRKHDAAHGSDAPPSKQAKTTNRAARTTQPAAAASVASAPEPHSAGDRSDQVKRLASLQRAARDDEETCCVCGRYGEYINDATDHDVCSLECKQVDSNTTLRRHVGSNVALHDKLEAIERGDVQAYVADKVHAKWTNYQEVADVRRVTLDQRRAIYKAHDLIVHGSRLPRPIASLDQCFDALGEQLHANAGQLGWHLPTSIQRIAIPVGLAGHDVYAVAPTHSGKTAAYLLPLLAHCQSLHVMHKAKRRYGPYALIVAPTRELAHQVESIAKALMQGIPTMRTCLLVGGQPAAHQLHRLRKGVQLIVATPGRLSEFARYHAPLLRLWRLHMVVLDEADAMFGLGFGKEIKSIMDTIVTSTARHHAVQVSLFSATTGHTNQKLQQRMGGYLNDPVFIQLAPNHLEHASSASIASENNDSHHAPRAATLIPSIPTPKVRQTMLWVENKSKPKRLYTILSNATYFQPPILIFVDSRLGTEFLARALQKRFSAMRVTAMHADMEQNERDAVVASLTRPNVVPSWDVVVTTDILARGMDLPLVRLVINYDMAASLDDYTHRIGRAVLPETQAPLDRRSPHRLGWTITFINEDHKHLLPSLAKMLGSVASSQVTPLPPQLKRYL
ncbi:P-loop containing nucleoside triphosphate hydrolase protein [Gongronella butleri]|nr:P-loop containing nucleoside triphosphate hydrolase protein [Gongronella butleri]